MGQFGTNIEYDIPIREVIDITRSRKNGKFCVTCLDSDRNEVKLWMTFPQFISFRRQCAFPCNAGIYAHCNIAGFLFTVFGNTIPMADYRMTACFDLKKDRLIFPVPPSISAPKSVEIDDDLRDQYSH